MEEIIDMLSEESKSIIEEDVEDTVFTKLSD
jgi:hypothetical protein